MEREFEIGECYMEWIYIIALGFIAIAYPVLMLIGIWSFPIHVIISFIIWIALSVIWMLWKKSKKISEYIGPIILLDLIFTIIYVSGGESSIWGGDMESDDFLCIMPSLSLPALCYVSLKLIDVRAANQNEKREFLLQNIKSNIETQLNETKKLINDINENFDNNKQLGKVVSLVDLCIENKILGSALSRAEDLIFQNQNERLKRTNDSLANSIPDTKNEFDNFVKDKKAQIKELEKLLANLENYDSKKLKELQKSIII